jgi:Holliday junction DNA helicase RuvB
VIKITDINPFGPMFGEQHNIITIHEAEKKKRPRVAYPGFEHIPVRPEVDPLSFDTYLGQDNIKERLRLEINAMKRGDSLKALFSASPGLGKTALARVLAIEMGLKQRVDHYFEIVAGKIESKKQLDDFIRVLPEYAFVFIDEIHGLQGLARDAMLPALADNVYAFDEGTDTMLPLPKGISWVGATTDVGKVHGALQRRLTVMTLAPMNHENRKELAMRMPIPVAEDAAEEMARRCWTPWEIKDEIYKVSSHIAYEHNHEAIELFHVHSAFDILDVDEHGLHKTERDVLKILYRSKRIVKKEVRYGMSARALIASVGIDNPTFYDKIEPRLLGRGFIQISAGVGRELTEKGLEYTKERF